ncbi:MAG: hypothetical protein GX628_08995 [Clostridiales bacterium]|nr:hypothetical protein [Clostridiales bacterium]
MLTQRLGSSTQLDPKFFGEFLETVKARPGSCDEVWFATCYGFPPLETHAETAEILKNHAAALREIGVRVSLQISNSIGHGQYMSARDCSGLVYDGSPVQNIVGPDGTVSRYTFCWSDPVMRDYIREEMKLYCEAIKPHTIWIDDDLRPGNHSPVQYGCFCDSCIERFNKRFNHTFTREQLAHEINYGEIAVREEWIEYLKSTLSDFTYFVYSVIHEYSPETRPGLQIGWPGGYTGNGNAYIYEAMYRATGFNPKSRPGGGAYSDNNPDDMLHKADWIAWQNSHLPELVDEIRPEIENLPDVRYGKTIAGTCYETTLYLASGANAMSYAMLMNDYEPMEWHGEMLSAFAAHRPYWLRLASVSSRTCGGGLKLFAGRSMYKRKLAPGDQPFSWTSEPVTGVTSSLRGLGIPVCFDGKNNPVYIIRPELAALYTDEEIEYLLARPVVTDGYTMEYLVSRGYGDAFSASVMRCGTEQLSERYTDHDVNSGMTGNRRWSQSFYIKEGCTLTDRSGKTEALGIYTTANPKLKPLFDSEELPFGIATAIVHTDRGGRWAVFGHSMWNRVVSSDRRLQILSAADYISNNRMPALLETPIPSAVYPREDSEGRTVSVSVLNRTIGASGLLRLRIRRPALPDDRRKLLFMAQGQPEQHLPFTRDGDDLIVDLPSLAPWTLGTVFLDL